MKMISFWSDINEIHVDDGLVLITGRYNHKNQSTQGEKTLGVHWENYPQSRGILSPCVIPESTRNAVLSGLLHQAAAKGEQTQIDQLVKAIKYFDE
ncbi:hypothetical protein GCM10009119_19510 [Algoriphagus jejuensis]|uniref:Uncharacterized protein n=1 Tax=Algoriphagus jejuensis TaxID=419934 RepID=A0ABP3YBZ6_9BACT